VNVLVAGVGNIFLGDDGFGTEVARRLRAETLPEGTKVVDFGIRGVHLAYELMDGYDALVLIDAAPHGVEPGTVSLIQPDLANLPVSPASAGILDAHGMEPTSVFSLLESLGEAPERTLVVACEPLDTGEGIGMTAPVAAAVDAAVALVRDLLADELVVHPVPSTSHPKERLP
jgi:hydrogenase maturation protease